MTVLFRSALALLLLLGTQVAHAADLPFHFDNAEITTMIQAYAKASGKQFIVDPGVRGKISVYNNSNVSLEEAYNILAESLAINGFTIIENGDTRIVKAARNAQRDMIPTLTKVPPPKPNLMVTMVFHPKYIQVEELNKRLRILPSKDGEMTPYEPSNQLIVSDFAGNVNRIAAVIDQLDTPEAAKWMSKPTAPRKDDGSRASPPTIPEPVHGPHPKLGDKHAKSDSLDKLFEEEN